MLLPDSIDPEILAAFIQERDAASKKPMTQRAIDMLLRKLHRLEMEGHDPNLLLERSIIGGWKDVYPSDETKRKVEDSFIARHTDKAWRQALN